MTRLADELAFGAAAEQRTESRSAPCTHEPQEALHFRQTDYRQSGDIGKHIARELHDGVIQELCFLRFQAQALVKRLDARRSDETAAAELLVSQVEQTLGAVREIVDQQGKRDVWNESLVDSIRDFASRVNQESGLKVYLTCQTTLPIADRPRFECFRIIQEAVRNAVKHSEAAAVRIRLRTRGNWLGLRVVDNGIGLAPDLKLEDRHVGLSSMEHRARSLGGEFQIWSRENVGTIIQAVVPRT